MKFILIDDTFQYPLRLFWGHKMRNGVVFDFLG